MSRPVSVSVRDFCTRPDRRIRAGRILACFLQITCDDSVELPVPEQKYTFGVVKAAQARGDFHVLADRGGARCGFILGSDLKAGGGLEAAVDKGYTSNESLESFCDRRRNAGAFSERDSREQADHAIGNGRFGPHGREHDASPDARWTSTRRFGSKSDSVKHLGR